MMRISLSIPSVRVEKVAPIGDMKLENALVLISPEMGNVRH